VTPFARQKFGQGRKREKLWRTRSNLVKTSGGGKKRFKLKFESGLPGTDVMIFKYIFDEKLSKKIGVFDSTQS
jgi:hypothetical protein